MIKTYCAATHVSISVILKNKKYLRIAFAPMTRGGSSFSTADKEIQEALEKHAGFGKMFKVSAVVDDTPKKAEKVEKEIKVVEVPSINDAREYLVERFNGSWTKLKTQEAIMNAGLANGIKFVIG